MQAHATTPADSTETERRPRPVMPPWRQVIPPRRRDEPEPPATPADEAGPEPEASAEAPRAPAEAQEGPPADVPTSEPILSVAEAALICGLSRSTIRRQIERGHIAATKDERRTWRIPVSSLIAAGLDPDHPRGRQQRARSEPPGPDLEKEKLRTENQILRERLESVLLVAREREARIADLRLLFRMLPAAGAGAASPENGSPRENGGRRRVPQDVVLVDAPLAGRRRQEDETVPLAEPEAVPPEEQTVAEAAEEPVLPPRLQSLWAEHHASVEQNRGLDEVIETARAAAAQGEWRAAETPRRRWWWFGRRRAEGVA